MYICNFVDFHYFKDLFPSGKIRYLTFACLAAITISLKNVG